MLSIVAYKTSLLESTDNKPQFFLSNRIAKCIESPVSFNTHKTTVLKGQEAHLKSLLHIHAPLLKPWRPAPNFHSLKLCYEDLKYTHRSFILIGFFKKCPHQRHKNPLQSPNCLFFIVLQKFM